MSELFSQSDGIVIVGKRGSGKTSILKFLINILSDPQYNFRFSILDIVGNLKDFESKSNMEYYLVDPNDKGGIDMVIDNALKEGNRSIVIDECDRYRHYETSKLSELVNIGRNYNVGYLATGRRTANIHKDFIVNANWVIVFKHTWPEDIDRITEWLNITDDTVRGLKRYEFLLIHDTDVIGKYRLNLPKGFSIEPSAKPTAQPISEEPDEPEDDEGPTDEQLDTEPVYDKPVNQNQEKPKEEKWP